MPPYAASTDEDVIAAIRAGQPRLPVEIDPRVPEPLQAIALKAMERDPALRYQSALELGADLQRYLDGRPVHARPSVYASTLGLRVAPHLEQIGEWLRLRLIYPHEAERLRSAYRALDAREDDWIVESRALSYSQIALYLGAFLLVCGSLFYFAAHRWYDAVTGRRRAAAGARAAVCRAERAPRTTCYRRDHQAVAVAFFLAAVGLLPLLLIILFHETGFLVVAPDTPGQLFLDGSISNRQLQVTSLVACLWCGALALRTRTAALSTVCAILVSIFGVSVLADLGLRSWLEDGRWDLLALHALPLVAVYAGLGALAERQQRPWFARPAYVAAALLLIVVLELLALDGRTFHYLGFSLQSLQSASVSDPLLLDTLAAMTLNGVGFYALAAALDRHGTELQTTAARLLFTLAPFAILQPLGYLVRTAEYSPRFDWIYLVLALVIALLSQTRQRRAFYYAGVLNTGAALYLIAEHRGWFDRPLWAIAVIVAGLSVLAAGFVFDRREKRRVPTAGTPCTPARIVNGQPIDRTGVRATSVLDVEQVLEAEKQMNRARQRARRRRVDDDVVVEHERVEIVLVLRPDEPGLDGERRHFRRLGDDAGADRIARHLRHAVVLDGGLLRRVGVVRRGERPEGRQRHARVRPHVPFDLDTRRSELVGVLPLARDERRRGRERDVRDRLVEDVVERRDADRRAAVPDEHAALDARQALGLEQRVRRW